MGCVVHFLPNKEWETKALLMVGKGASLPDRMTHSIAIGEFWGEEWCLSRSTCTLSCLLTRSTHLGHSYFEKPPEVQLGMRLKSEQKESHPNFLFEKCKIFVSITWVSLIKIHLCRELSLCILNSVLFCIVFQSLQNGLMELRSFNSPKSYIN